MFSNPYNLQGRYFYTHFTDQEHNAQMIKETDSQWVGCKARVHIHEHHCAPLDTVLVTIYITM